MRWPGSKARQGRPRSRSWSTGTSTKASKPAPSKDRNAVYNLTGRRSMRKLAVVVSLLVAVGLMALVAAAFADRGHGHHGGNGGTRFSAKLVGFEETPSEST